jgi:hypothetical protein
LVNYAEGTGTGVPVCVISPVGLLIFFYGLVASQSLQGYLYLFIFLYARHRSGNKGLTAKKFADCLTAAIPVTVHVANIASPLTLPELPRLSPNLCDLMSIIMDMMLPIYFVITGTLYLLG